MGLGVLEDRHTENVPGTSVVLGPDVASSRLKKDCSGPTDIILVPQPSDDPNDPLNWPIWRRDLIVVILSLVSVMAAALSPILAANTLTLSLQFRRDFTAIALLTGYHLCGVGVAGVFFVASARVWGRRHLYLLGTVFLIVTSAWAGASRSYESLLAARVFQGIAVAPFEALVNASVGDLYFVHQRGVRMALTNLALFGSAFFTPIVVGKMTYTIGWPWSFYFVAIFSALLLPLVVFFVPETAYRRPPHLNTDIAHSDGSRSRPQEGAGGLPNGGESLVMAKSGAGEEVQDGGGAAIPKVGFAESLMPFNGRKTDQSFFALLLRPFPLFFQPAVFWACLIQGTLIGWTVLIGVVLAAIFLGPPLFFNEVETGYMYTGAFVGAVLGFVFSGLFSDWSARFMTRRNGGVYEPEFRIVLVIPQLICGCAGLYGFGITGANVAKYGFIWPDIFFALEVMGMVIGAVASALYIVDAYRDISTEAFTCLLIFKNIFSFGLTWSAYGWILDNGIQTTFYIIASVQVAICLLSIPMYIYGKRIRAYSHRHDILGKIHLG
ncbi:MAG: hypothetical protein M1832_003273 [Thelocarpon impressellum]|nr:MAG: hypothetical protein M1832_003273 [Thelocarpon impressellum]